MKHRTLMTLLFASTLCIFSGSCATEEGEVIEGDETADILGYGNDCDILYLGELAGCGKLEAPAPIDSRCICTNSGSDCTHVEPLEDDYSNYDPYCHGTVTDGGS